jgi:hypothetical protein
MKKRTKTVSFKCLFIFVLATFCLMGFNPAYAEWTPGKTYDKNNYQEIEDLLFPFLIARVKSGDFILKTGALDFDMKITDPWFLEASKKNEGRFALDEGGYVIEKTGGKRPGFFQGLPFPTIDAKDPQVAPKIMENLQENICKTEAHLPVGLTWFLSADSATKERELTTGGIYMYYRNRYHGPLENPQNFLKQTITEVFGPYDVRGTVIMNWDYDDARESSSFSYLPMLRRIRRMSAAARSDPFMGGDSCVDDAGGYAGKNQDMDFKFSGEDRKLVCLTTNKMEGLIDNPDGSLGFPNNQYTYSQPGFEVPGFKGASYYPVSAVWTPRDVWLIEMNPKDPYYNYGKQIMVIDKDNYDCFFKLIWDRAGQYWKTVIIAGSYRRSPSGRTTTGFHELYLCVDDRTRHATYYQQLPQQGRSADVSIPSDRVSEKDFTLDAIMQRSK